MAKKTIMAEKSPSWTFMKTWRPSSMCAILLLATSSWKTLKVHTKNKPSLFCKMVMCCIVYLVSSPCLGNKAGTKARAVIREESVWKPQHLTAQKILFFSFGLRQCFPTKLFTTSLPADVSYFLTRSKFEAAKIGSGVGFLHLTTVSSKGYSWQLWLVDFDPCCLFLWIYGSLLASSIIMIGGSEKCNYSAVGFWTLEVACCWNEVSCWTFVWAQKIIIKKWSTVGSRTEGISCLHS